ncbi:DUF998 domain-containing protein [Leucobacter weissii]|uniref:DUF998 domain-containing protein n=1 Tax=Leucobacter weissii TaxID=1983706 RepID=A0A939MLJ3_9MICO|nr:DUF998 domain-containing protein [Leucobacter weissii]MBO1902480.1 DUF998 domain-containing protein [Leucobacter weissii]
MSIRTAPATLTGTPHALRRWRIGGTILIIGPLLYWVIEAIGAMAWDNPRYSYVFNYISDLGVPNPGTFEGRPLDSELHLLVNIAGFALQGVLLLAATIMLWRTVSAPVMRWFYLIISAFYAAGLILVASFHGSDAAVADGTAVWHGVGALPTFVGANIILILIGIHLFRRRQQGFTSVGSRVVGALFATLGVVGISALITLLSISGSSVDGLVERIVIYPFLAAQVIAGVGLLRATRHTSNSGV